MSIASRIVTPELIAHLRGRFQLDRQGIHGALHWARVLANGLRLANKELALLTAACEGHSNGGLEGDVTVCTCWDADRLDLGRVNIRPRPERLCMAAARNRDVIEWAYRNRFGGVRREDWGTSCRRILA